MSEENNIKKYNGSSWNNGSPNYITGSGLGIKIIPEFTNTIFNNNLTTLELYNNEILISDNINVDCKACKELINKEIGLWMINNNFHQWNSGVPHRFMLTHQKNNVFNIVKV